MGRSFGRFDSREDIIGYVRHLEGKLAEAEEEIARRDKELAQLRCCGNPDCYLCPECVTALLIKARPAPLTLARKYEIHAGGVRDR